MQKNEGNVGKIVKTRPPFLARYGHPRTPERSKNDHFSQRIVFTLLLGFFRRYRPKVLSQNAQKDVCLPEVLFQSS